MFSSIIIIDSNFLELAPDKDSLSNPCPDCLKKVNEL